MLALPAETPGLRSKQNRENQRNRLNSSSNAAGAQFYAQRYIEKNEDAAFGRCCSFAPCRKGEQLPFSPFSQSPMLLSTFPLKPVANGPPPRVDSPYRSWRER
jgi:hypothetical protein